MGGRGEARAQLGAPARPPREPTAARELVELGRPASTRPIYSPGAAPRQGKAHRGRGQSADPPGSPGNTARRLADVRRFLGLSLVAANFFPLGRGRGGQPGRLGSVRTVGPFGCCWVAAAARSRSFLPLWLKRWKALPRSVTRTEPPWTCLSPSGPAGQTGTTFISHSCFCLARGSCKMQQYCDSASCQAGRQRVFGTGGPGLAPCPVGGGSGLAARGDLGVGAGATSLEEQWCFSPPLSPPRLCKQDLCAGACGAGLSV